MRMCMGKAASMDLPHSEQTLVLELVVTNFHGFGEARLCKLPPPVLTELSRMCTPDGEATPKTREDQVAVILAKKKEAKKAKSKEPTLAPVAEPIADPGPGAEPETPCPPPSSPSPPPPSPPRALFQLQHTLSIVSFNSLKLRVEKPELANAWAQLADEFSKHDIIHLSEVRAGAKHQHRIARFLDMLNARGGEWSFVCSDESGPGAPEIHVLFVKHPVKIAATNTLHHVAGTPMDHAPLVATLVDDRFLGELRKVNVVCTHMPPNGDKRRSARDAQIRALLRLYPLESSLRLQQPFTNKGARETAKRRNFVAHVLMGDFNADSLELRELGADENGWELALGSVRTSAGGASYDNFLVNKDALDHVCTGARVLALADHANFARGLDGVSDHSPIVLQVTEVPRCRPLPRRRSGSPLVA